MPYHMAVPASHAELLRYHHMPTAAGHYGFVPPVSMVNGYMYPSQQPVMYPLSFPGMLLSARLHRCDAGISGHRPSVKFCS